jgi:hypothetical protein
MTGQVFECCTASIKNIVMRVIPVNPNNYEGENPFIFPVTDLPVWPAKVGC